MPNRLSLLRALMAVALLAGALAFTACGGDEDSGLSKDDYKKKAQQISDKFEADFQTALPNATSKNAQKSLAGVNQITLAGRQAADGLDELEPPSEHKAVHGKLVGALRTLVTRGEAVDQAVEAKDEAGAEQAVSSFQAAIRELDTVGDEYDKAVGTT